jgi:hypothetical protein
VASTKAGIDHEFLRRDGELPKRLEQVDQALGDALRDAGYVGSSYFGVPGGFALITQVEQTDGKGRPLRGKRWSPRIATIKSFTLVGILRALLTAEPGFFRVLALIVQLVVFGETRYSAPDQARAGTNVPSCRPPPALPQGLVRGLRPVGARPGP